MPGVIGLIPHNSLNHTSSTFERMLKPMQRGGRLKEETLLARNGAWALGRVHLGVYHPQPQLSTPEDIHILFHGQLDNEDALRAALQQEGCTPPAGVIALMDHLYRQWGTGCLARLRGAFCAVILDERGKTLILANDALGSYPLYWYTDSQHFVFASELKSVLQGRETRPSLNPQAVADYLTFGFLVGNKTLDPSVQLLAPGSFLTYRWDNRECVVEPYTRLDSLFHPWAGTEEEYHEELRPLFNGAVQRVVKGAHRIGLSLSGGLDSRMILSAAADNNVQLFSYTLGVKGCADEVIAAQLAHLAQSEHVFGDLDGTHLKDFVHHLKRMVDLTDGMYLTHGLTELLAIRLVEQGGYDVLLRGHGAELAKVSLAWPLHTDSNIFQMKKKEEFIPYILNRVNYISSQAPLNELFMPDWWKQIEGESKRSLEVSLAQIDATPADLCSYLYLVEHHRRFTIPSLELFRNYAEVELPFVDYEFLKVLWSGPSKWRDGTDIHRSIVGHNNMAMLKVRNSNTGAPGDAGPWAEAFYDKLNSLFKRLNVPGYRHYHAFDSWMQETLINSVEEVMLDPRTLGRGMYQEATLRKMMADTRAGRADYAYLFQILLILELWQGE
ncbi:MAG: hypothetical protein IH978_10455 [Nitrospinae bacterium]|nr:hypothetical protein [Nitrospinota bacterium]